MARHYDYENDRSEDDDPECDVCGNMLYDIRDECAYCASVANEEGENE